MKDDNKKQKRNFLFPRLSNQMAVSYRSPVGLELASPTYSFLLCQRILPLTFLGVSTAPIIHGFIDISSQSLKLVLTHPLFSSRDSSGLYTAPCMKFLLALLRGLSVKTL